jgi:hypothetical protein
MKAESFAKHLEESLEYRYAVMSNATPENILLAVLNAVAEARQKAQEEEAPDGTDNS